MSEIVAMKIIRNLNSHGYQAYMVGGCVRDLKLGLTPHDYDVATDALPSQIKEIFPESKSIGESFGVSLVEAVQIATFRMDIGNSDGRHPDEVKYSQTLYEDAERRDFTINALYMDSFGSIVDPLGGVSDLNRKVLRFVGIPDERIKEDYLRMLRAIRFALRFGFEIEWESWIAIQEYAPEILSISRERIFQELTKIFVHPSRGRALSLLRESGLLKYVLPEIHNLYGVQQPKKYHPEGDVFKHTSLALEFLPTKSSKELVWATVLHDVGKPNTQAFKEDGEPTFYGHDTVGSVVSEKILRGLKADNETIQKVVEMVKNHMKFRFFREMRTAKLVRFVRRPTFMDEMELHKVDCLSSNKKLDNYEFIRNFMERVEKFSPTKERVQTLINGNDLIHLGYSPSPIFRTILESIEDLILERSVVSKEQALSWVVDNYARK